MASEQIQQILELIRDARKRRGFSQQQLAEKLGLSQNGYKNIEIGKTDLKVEMLMKIMEALDINNDIFKSPSQMIETGGEEVLLPTKMRNLEDLYRVITQELATKTDIEKQNSEIAELKDHINHLEDLIQEWMYRNTSTNGSATE